MLNVSLEDELEVVGATEVRWGGGGWGKRLGGARSPGSSQAQPCHLSGEGLFTGKCFQTETIAVNGLQTRIRCMSEGGEGGGRSPQGARRGALDGEFG